MFEEAIRNKYRFPSSVGMISTEDLWDLTLEKLDTIYRKLNSELKRVEEDSLLTTETKQNQEVKNKIEIVKHVFTIKSNEQNERLQAKDKAEKKQYLLSLLQQKQDETYKSKSIEELQALIDAI